MTITILLGKRNKYETWMLILTSMGWMQTGDVWEQNDKNNKYLDIQEIIGYWRQLHNETYSHIFSTYGMQIKENNTFGTVNRNLYPSWWKRQRPFPKRCTSVSDWRDWSPKKILSQWQIWVDTIHPRTGQTQFAECS